MFEKWHRHCLEQMQAIRPEGLNAEQESFFAHHYRANQPQQDRFVWPALEWTLEKLGTRIGNPMVQVQTGRNLDPQYEIRSFMHREIMPFWRFLRKLSESRVGNEVYLTAQNADYNREQLKPLWRDVTPLPSYLTPDPARGFVWLGYKTITPLHHDETNNVLFQVIGDKRVRLIPPSQHARLSPRGDGVHSELFWLADEVIEERGIVGVEDILLQPGDSLFIPIGWWHCIDTPDVSLTLTYTNFIWPNFFGQVGGFA